MDENELQSIVSELEAATSNGDVRRFTAAVARLDRLLVDYDQWPSELFLSVVALIRLERFVVLPESWKLVRVFESYWELLSPPQVENLLTTLEASYTAFSDWMACFMVTELLGTCVADERGLEIALRLLARAAGRAKSLIPHALEHIALSAKEVDVSSAARQVLRRLISDESPEVRNEAELALAKVETKMEGRR